MKVKDVNISQIQNEFDRCRAAEIDKGYCWHSTKFGEKLSVSNLSGVPVVGYVVGMALAQRCGVGSSAGTLGKGR